MGKRIRVEDQLDAYRRGDFDPRMPDPRHPKYEEYKTAVLRAYEAWHYAEYRCKSPAQSAARIEANRLRQEEVRLWSEIMEIDELIQEPLF